MPASQAESAFGSQIQRGNGATPEVFMAIAEVRDFDGPEETVDTEEVTNHSSPSAYKEKIGMLIDTGDVDFDVNWIGDTSQSALRTDLRGRIVHNYRVLDPDGTGVQFGSLVVKLGKSRPVEGILTGSFTLRPVTAITDV